MHKLQFSDIKYIYIHRLADLNRKDEYQSIIGFSLEKDFNQLRLFWTDKVRTLIYKNGVLSVNLKIDFNRFDILTKEFSDYLIGSYINGD
jgi:hypothetical protein